MVHLKFGRMYTTLIATTAPYVQQMQINETTYHEEYWAEAAKNAPSLYEYLRDNVHNNEENR